VRRRHAREDPGAAGPLHGRHGFVQGLPENGVVDVEGHVRLKGAGGGAGSGHDVRGQLQINRPGVLDAGGEGVVDQARGLRGVGEHGRLLRHLPEDVALQVHVTERMVQEVWVEPAPQGDFRPAAYHHEGHPLGVRPGHGVVYAETSDAVGETNGAKAGHAGVSVRRVSRVKLVAGRDHRDVAPFQDVEEGEDVVTRHAEDVPGAELFEPARQVGPDGRPLPLRHGSSFTKDRVFPDLFLLWIM
jgi:hypothetical protein